MLVDAGGTLVPARLARGADLPMMTEEIRTLPMMDRPRNVRLVLPAPVVWVAWHDGGGTLEEAGVSGVIRS